MHFSYDGDRADIQEF
jgi:hypothetical protein